MSQVNVRVLLAMFDRTDTAPAYRRLAVIDSIESWCPLGPSQYNPRGMTPLRDATAMFISDLRDLSSQRPRDAVLGLLIDESGSMRGNAESVVAGINEFVDGMREVSEVDAEAGGAVFAAVLTDGLENASEEVSPAMLRQLIAQCEADDWTFIYLGANQDAWTEGDQLGYSGSAKGQTVNFRADAAGTRAALRSVREDAQMHLRGKKAYEELRASSARRAVTDALTPEGTRAPSTLVDAAEDVKRAHRALGRRRDGRRSN